MGLKQMWVEELGLLGAPTLPSSTYIAVYALIRAAERWRDLSLASAPGDKETPSPSPNSKAGGAPEKCFIDDVLRACDEMPPREQPVMKWLTNIQEQVLEAAQEVGNDLYDDEDFYERLVTIAALCLAAVETGKLRDRKKQKA